MKWRNFLAVTFFVLPGIVVHAQKYEYPIEATWVNETYSKMSREERIGQLLMVGGFSEGNEKNTKEILNYIKKYHIGGVLFFKGEPYAQVRQTNLYQKKSKIPLLIAIDGEWGVAMRLRNVVKFSRQMGITAANNDSLVYSMGKEVAHQCKTLGIHINFAPDADVNNNPDNPVINDRAFSDDKYTVTRLANLYMKGMQDNGILACIKHFPGHGDTKTDSHLDLPRIEHSRERLEDVELYPFKELINKGAASLMVAHMEIPAFDTTSNLPTSLSKRVIKDYLIDTLGFKGLIFTDAMNMKGVAKYYSQGEAAVMALQAGNDILLTPTQLPKVVKAIEEALDSNWIDSAQFEHSVKKVLAAKYQLGLTKAPKLSTTDLNRRLNPFSARLLQEQMSEQQITVVKNRKDLLPLRNLEKKKVASIALGFRDKTTFQRMLGNYCRADYYQYSNTVDSLAFDIALQELRDKDYDLYIVSIHNTNRTPDEFYGINPAAIHFINQLNKKEKIVLVSFGIPYNLQYFPNMEHLVVGYQDTKINQEKAAQLLFGVFTNTAQLPVQISEEYAKGTGINIDQRNLLHYQYPEASGYNSDEFKRLDKIVNKALKQKAMPGCQLLVSHKGKVVFSKAYGYTTYDKDNREEITTDMLYDIASVSKIMGTTLAVMHLYERGKLKLDRPASRYLKELRKSNKKNITLKQLLTHTAGLQAWIPFYKETLDDSLRSYNVYCYEEGGDYVCKVGDNIYMRNDYRDTLWQNIIDSEVKPTGNYKYSDLSFFILQKVVEKVSKMPLDQYVEKHFYKPLGLGTMTYNPLEKFDRSMIVPTENDNEFRKQLVWGYVHDPAAAMLGGVAGNAGLFSNTNDIAVIMQMLLNKGSYGGERYFKPKTVKLFTSQAYPDLRRGLGFDKPEGDPKKGNPTADIVPTAAFGHSGFTGAITWADPVHDIIYVFLSNRVHPSASNNIITKTSVRSNIHEEIYRIILRK
jgi:beta-glucosidase-like glycosyl hydrolase/CubicO group peptidase (beta-lactamase class C family)